MTFTINQQNLWPVLQTVSRSCGVRSQLPVLANIHLQAQSGRLKLSATNLEIGLVKSLTAEVSEEGEVTVPARTLSEIIAHLSPGEIVFEANSDTLKISTPSFSAQINGIPATEFPAIPLSGKETVSIDPDVLAKSLPEVTFAAAVDEGRPVLNGILTRIHDKKLQLVATDGYRLAHKSVEVAQEGSFKALIPRRTFEEVIRLLSEDEGDEVLISTADNQNQMIFTFGNSQLSSRLIEGRFPVWEKIIPEQFKARVVVDRAELLKSVKLASVFAKNEANVVKFHNLSDKIVLTSETKEVGSQQSEVHSLSEGEELVVAFNTKFLAEALGAFKSSQAILELSGPLSAAVLKPMGEENLFYIIMPVNLG